MSKRLSDQERALRVAKVGGPGQPSKYGNKRTTVNGHSFASQREAGRYQELVLLLRGGYISDLRLQVRYPLSVNGVKLCTYTCDFAYKEAGVEIIEDAKGFRTPVYRLKRKLVEALYGVVIRET